MRKVAIYKAKTHLSKLLATVEQASKLLSDEIARFGSVLLVARLPAKSLNEYGLFKPRAAALP